MASATRDALIFHDSKSVQIDSYIRCSGSPPSRPHVTLTFATSLDSSLSIAPGVQTALSGTQSKSMTHYLRSKHDAIFIGVGTAVADDPSLNCRIEGVGGYGGEGLNGQPRPIVLDPNGRWQVSETSKVIKLARDGRGRAPWIITGPSYPAELRRGVERVGGRVLALQEDSSIDPPSKLHWDKILAVLAEENVRSVMIEGGGTVINDLLSPENQSLIDSVIITIAPTWLGRNGVQICPNERFERGSRVPVGRLKDVTWITLGEDAVLCGRLTG